jgi:hypothetical protein
MILRKWRDSEILKRKHEIALCGEIALEVTTDQSFKTEYRINE